MRPVAELDLTHLAMEEPGFAENPYPHFAAARRRHPWLATSSYGLVVHQYSAIKDLLGMDDKMRVAHEGMVELMNAKGSAWGRFQLESILGQSGASHKRVRDVLAPMFTPRKANEHRHLMRRVVSELLDQWAPKGRFDFEEFASYFPVTVMCSLIGAPSSEMRRLRKSLETLGLSFSLIPDFLPQLEEAVAELDEFVTQLVADRRAGKRLNPEPDLLDALIQSNDKGDLSSAEMNNLLIFLFVAGFDTSKNILTLIMYHLLDRPEMYARCAEDPAYCKLVMEEVFRYTSPATIPRITNEDVVYRDVLIPKDTMLFFPVSVAGRDPTAIPNPDEFQPERNHVNRHMAFGRGAHICLGQFIARAQIEEGLHLMAQRLTNPRRDGPNGWRPFPGVWGIRGLPIAFDPVPARKGTSAALDEDWDH